MKTLLVDDEPLALDLMRTILADIDAIEVIGCCSNGRECIRQVQALQPDLLFLDIEMPGIGGFEVVKALQADITPLVIFATAFDRYALQAFDLHAVDYVLKPFDPERIQRAVQRAAQRYEVGRQADRKAPLIGAIDDIANATRPGRDADGTATPQFEKLAIRDRDSVELVPYEAIEWIDAAGDYMCVHADGKTHVLRCTIKQLEEKLPSERFARIHRSTLVNLDKIQSIKALSKGEFSLFMNDVDQLKVSRTYRQAILPLIN